MAPVLSLSPIARPAAPAAHGAAAARQRPLTTPRAAGDGGGDGPTDGATAAHAKAAVDAKGFGGAKTKAGPPPPAKVSKRGTVASRGGPPPAQTRAAYDAIEGRASSSTSTGQQQNFSPSPSSSSGPPVQEVSPVVNARMFRRMLTFAGIPIAVGLVGLPTAYYLKKVLGWDLPNYAVYAFQSLAWGGGLLGITYGILSSSWDPGFEGSALGITEAKANLGALVERGQRKREGK